MKSQKAASWRSTYVGRWLLAEGVEGRAGRRNCAHSAARSGSAEIGKSFSLWEIVQALEQCRPMSCGKTRK